MGLISWSGTYTRSQRHLQVLVNCGREVIHRSLLLTRARIPLQAFSQRAGEIDIPAAGNR
jgi:hypothetical protein